MPVRRDRQMNREERRKLKITPQGRKAVISEFVKTTKQLSFGKRMRVCWSILRGK